MSTPEQPRYTGLYRGLVEDARDPLGRGRLRIRVPAINGSGALKWALPSSPVGWSLHLPSRGEPVWVVFENGHPDAPVWLGTWKAEAVAAPPPPPAPEVGASTSYARFTFPTPAASWPVAHGLGRYPQVTVLDSSGAEMLAQVEHGSTTALTVTHSGPTAGSVHLTA